MKKNWKKKITSTLRTFQRASEKSVTKTTGMKKRIHFNAVFYATLFTSHAFFSLFVLHLFFSCFFFRLHRFVLHLVCVFVPWQTCRKTFSISHPFTWVWHLFFYPPFFSEHETKTPAANTKISHYQMPIFVFIASNGQLPLKRSTNNAWDHIKNGWSVCLARPMVLWVILTFTWAEVQGLTMNKSTMNKLIEMKEMSFVCFTYFSISDRCHSILSLIFNFHHSVCLPLPPPPPPACCLLGWQWWMHWQNNDKRKKEEKNRAFVKKGESVNRYFESWCFHISYRCWCRWWFFDFFLPCKLALRFFVILLLFWTKEESV